MLQAHALRLLVPRSASSRSRGVARSALSCSAGLDIIEDDQQASYEGGMRQPLADSDYRWLLYDVSFETGTIRWSRELRRSAPLAAKHPKNSYASETPVTDGRRVYVGMEWHLARR